MRKVSVLIFMTILSCQNLFAPQQQQEQHKPLFTRKECCILAAWMLAGASTKAYEMFYAPQAKPEQKAPTLKKMS